jgi:hypothetical protein
VYKIDDLSLIISGVIVIFIPLKFKPINKNNKKKPIPKNNVNLRSSILYTILTTVKAIIPRSNKVIIIIKKIEIETHSW